MNRKILVVFALLVTMVGFAYRCYVADKPIMAVAISSCSMEPCMRRGDVVFIRPVRNNTNFYVNQIILFKAEEHGISEWIMHRIVDGCAHEGFITQGDNNHLTDQKGLGFPRVMPEWIGGHVPKIGKTPFKIPMLGHVTLMMDENLNTYPFVIGLTINTAFMAIFGFGYWIVRRMRRYCIGRYDIKRFCIKRYYSNRKKVNV